MFCPYCGTQIPDDARFCGGCGKDLSVGSTPEMSAQSNVQPEAVMVEQFAVESVFEPANSTDEISDVAAQDTTPQSKKRKKIIIGAIIAVVVIVIGIIVGMSIWNAEQDRLDKEQVEEIELRIDGILATTNEIDPNVGEGANRETLLQQYSELLQANDAVLNLESDGGLSLRSGKVYDPSAKLKSVEDKLSEIRQWFIANYQAQLNADSFASDATASSMSPSDCQAKIDALNELLALIDREAIIWDGSENGSSELAALKDSVNAQIAQGNNLLPQIKALEEEKANGFIGSWGYNSQWDYPDAPSFDLSMLEFYSDGTGKDRHRFFEDKFRWTRSSVVDGKVTISTTTTSSSVSSNTGFTDSYIYDINADTLRSSSGIYYTRGRS